MTLRPLVCTLFALLCLAFTARADAPPDPDTTRVYVGKGQTLTVNAPRQLSLNAHVEQVLVQPGSLEAAYTGATDNGDTVTNFVRLVGFSRGETQTLLQGTGTTTPDTTLFDYSLCGWSGDGRYLIVSHTDYAGLPNPRPDNGTVVCDSVDVGVLPPKVRRVAVPPSTPEGSGLEGPLLASPSGKLFAAGCLDPPVTGTEYTESAFLYDPRTDSGRRIPLALHDFLRGWIDDTHLLIMQWAARERRFLALDIRTGAETPFRPAPLVLGAGRPFAPARPSLVSRRFPEVTLSLSEMPAVLPAPQGNTHADARALWLNVKGARPNLPPVCLAVALGTDTLNAELVPDHSAALWRQNGDLYVSTFAEEAATVREKYDAGDALTCDEERDIAEDNAKQLGLGLIQYTQDYDEQFPPAANFHSGVMPYLQNEGVFHEGTHPFSYAAPADLHLSALDDVSHTILGTIHLPCAVVTLYADGHVKSEPVSAPGTLSP